MEYLRDTTLRYFLEPGNLAVVVFALALVLTDFPERWFYKLARSIMALAAGFLLLLCLFPLGELALRPLENLVPVYPLPEKLDGIILLTGDEDAQLSQDRQAPLAQGAAQREMQAARLAHRYPEAKLVIAGAPTVTSTVDGYSVKKIIQDNMKAMGIPEDRIVYEERSRTTYENAVLSYELIHPAKGQSWALVTSAYHMPRAVLSFYAAGWNVIPSASDYLTSSSYRFTFPVSLWRQLRLLAIASHEYAGLIAYRAFGWIDRLWI